MLELPKTRDDVTWGTFEVPALRWLDDNNNELLLLQQSHEWALQRRNMRARRR